MNTDREAKVSVVIPCFNAAKYLPASLESLTKQSFKNLEIIVVDDFSTDDSADVVSSISAMDPRVVLLRNATKGANFARMMGVAHATGKFIAFMDADDQWALDAFSVLVNRFYGAEVDLVCCNMYSIVGEFSSLLYTYRELDKCLSYSENSKGFLDVPPSACAKLFSADLLKGVWFDDVPFTQDWNISYKALGKAKAVLFIDVPLYYYIRRDGSTCSVRRAVVSSELLNAERSIVGIRKYYSENGIESARSLFLSVIECRFYLDLAIRSCWIESLQTQGDYLRQLARKICILNLLKVLVSDISTADRRKVVTLMLFTKIPGAYWLMRKIYTGRGAA